MFRKNLHLSALGVAPLALLVACSGSSGTGTAAQHTTALTSAIAEVPVVGQFLADCSDTAIGIIDDFVAGLPLPEAPVEVPSAEQVLAMADPNLIPVIGGLVPGGVLPGDLVPVSIDDALSMIPGTGLPVGLPVVASVPVTCSDVALPSGSLPDPTDALGLVAVFNSSGDPVALILATVGQVQGGGLPIDDLGLPGGVDTLPAPLGSATSTLLGLLDMLGLLGV